MTTQPTQSVQRDEHAVVLGGSMAGLVTAQALSRHFRRVTVVERDHLPAGPAARAGVPQGRHLHALLPGGADALETLLPGYADGLLGAGAVPLAVPTDMLWLNPAGWVTRFPVRHRMLSASRELIEWHTRRLVMATPEITVLDGRNVADLCVSEDGSRVTGVTVVETDAAGSASHGPVETLPAELVVDATGRRSRLPGWLERLGYERPAETRINAHLAYATRIYRRPDDDRGWKAIYIQSRPSESSRMGIMFPIEGDRWILTVQGAGDDRPPTDGAGFDEFTASLRSSAIHDALRDAEPLTAPGRLRQHGEPPPALRQGAPLAGTTPCRRRQCLHVQSRVRARDVGRCADRGGTRCAAHRARTAPRDARRLRATDAAPRRQDGRRGVDDRHRRRPADGDHDRCEGVPGHKDAADRKSVV